MSRRFGRALAGLLVLGTAVRLAVAFATDGSAFDTESFRLVAEQLQVAPLELYEVLGGDAYRWPYPPGFLPWILGSRELADASGISFITLISLPAIAADAAIAWLVQDGLGRRRAGERTRLAAAALVALGPPFVVAAGHLPQIDSVAFLPAVAAVWLWDRGGRPLPGGRALAAGLLIGAGCAIKTLPILVVFALLPTCRDTRERLTLLAAAAVVPIVALAPFAITSPGDLVGTFDYAGVPGAGGLSLIVQPEMAERWLTEFHGLNRFNEALLANRTLWTALTVAAVALFVGRRHTRPAIAASLLWLAFYVTGTGFFFQYLIWGIPFFLLAGAVRPVAALQAAVALPMLFFYLAPWESGAIPVIYFTLMAGVWIGLCAALIAVARREDASARAEHRLGPRISDRLLSRASRPATTEATGGLAGGDPDRGGPAAGDPDFSPHIGVDPGLPPGPEPEPESVSEPGPGPGRTPGPGRERERARRRWPLALAAVAAGAFSLIPLALALAHAAPGDVLTGADGPYAADQLQYMAWIRDAAGSVAADNAYSLDPSGHVYLHPMFALSGAIDALTGSIQLSWLIWKPLAIGLLVAGFWLYVRRFTVGAGARIAALVLALAFASPAGPLGDWLATGELAEQLASVGGESFTATLLWGYLPTAIALGLVPLFLLAVEGIVDPTRRRAGRPRSHQTAAACALGALASWIHPWQGQLLVVAMIALAVWWPGPGSRMLLALPAAAAALPLVYYLALSERAPAWELTRLANAGEPLPLAVIAVALLPLLLPALAAFGGAGNSTGERLLRIWAPAAIGLHFVNETVPEHAFAGIALPLSILAVRGWQRIRSATGRRSAVAAAIAVALAVIPGAAWTIAELDSLIADRAQPHLLRDGEARALEYVRSSAPGEGVLSTAYLGAAVPAFTESRVWAGHPSWTPDWPARAAAAENLFDGDLPPPAARRLVAGSGATILVSDCRGRASLARALGPLLAESRSFGCATVHRLRKD